MNKFQRRTYFTALWPRACKAQGWKVNDNDVRREVTLYATGKESTTALTQADVTALFCYLKHKGNPHDVQAELDWHRCSENPEAFNAERQGQYWERRAYGAKGSQKLRRQRFGGRVSGVGDTPGLIPATELDAKQYRLTMRNRAKRKSDQLSVTSDQKSNLSISSNPF